MCKFVSGKDIHGGYKQLNNVRKLYPESNDDNSHHQFDIKEIFQHYSQTQFRGIKWGTGKYSIAMYKLMTWHQSKKNRWIKMLKFKPIMTDIFHIFVLK